MRPLLALRARLIAGLIVLLPVTASADPVGYAVAFDTLYRVDLGTGQATRIGRTGFFDIDGLAFSPSGVLYGVADAAVQNGSLSDTLIRINLDTGVGTLVGALSGLQGAGPGGNLDYGLAFTCDGRLWMSSDSTGQLWEVAPVNASVRLVGDTNAPISGLAARGSALFGIGVRQGFGDAAQQAAYLVDTENASVTRLGSLGVSDTLSSAGADFDVSGTLWAMLDSQPPDVDRPSRIARIDTTSGVANVTRSVVGVDGDVSLRSLAISPPGFCGGAVTPEPRSVPGPGAPLLALLGVLALALGLNRARQA